MFSSGCQLFGEPSFHFTKKCCFPSIRFTRSSFSISKYFSGSCSFLRGLRAASSRILLFGIETPFSFPFTVCGLCRSCLGPGWDGVLADWADQKVRLVGLAVQLVDLVAQLVDLVAKLVDLVDLVAKLVGQAFYLAQEGMQWGHHGIISVGWH